jgi:hypothetical protein
LLNLNELNEQNKIIIKARIDEFMLYKSMLWEWLKTENGFKEMLKWTKIYELALAINFKDLYNYYKENFWNNQVKDTKELSVKSKKLRENIWIKTFKELEEIWMWSGDEMLTTMNSINKKITTIQDQINKNNIEINI